MRERWRALGRWQRSVAFRLLLAGVAILLWGALALLTVVVRTGGGTSVTFVNGRYVTTALPAHTFGSPDPTAIRILLGGVAFLLFVGVSSLIWRITRRSYRVGITGLIAAGVAGVMVLGGAFTIGLAFVPFAFLLTALALPVPLSGSSDPAPEGASSLTYPER